MDRGEDSVAVSCAQLCVPTFDFDTFLQFVLQESERALKGCVRLGYFAACVPDRMLGRGARVLRFSVNDPSAAVFTERTPEKVQQTPELKEGSFHGEANFGSAGEKRRINTLQREAMRKYENVVLPA